MARYRAVTDELARNRSSPLAHALNNPLTLSLLRDTYRATGPVNELLDTARFPTPQNIDDHLLDQVLVTAYIPRLGQPPPRYSLDTARSTLSFIAYRLNQDGTRDLAWWHIPQWTSDAARARIARRAGGLAVGLTGWLAGWLAGGFLNGLASGFASGLTAGFTFGHGTGRRHGGSRHINTSWWRSPLLVRGLVDGLAGGLTVGFMPGLPLGLAIGIDSGLSAGLMFGLATVLLVGSAAAPGSYLALSAFTSDHAPAGMQAAMEVFKHSRDPIFPRTRDEVMRMFGDLERVEPGLVYTPEWRPEGPQSLGSDPVHSNLYAGVAVKP
jgi:hypothetical protein